MISRRLTRALRARAARDQQWDAGSAMLRSEYRCLAKISRNHVGPRLARLTGARLGTCYDRQISDPTGVPSVTLFAFQLLVGTRQPR